MKITRYVIFLLLILVIGITAIIFIVATAGAAVSEANAVHSGSSARAQIPYDFWIVGTHLPAGEYTLSPVVDTVVLFRNVKTNESEQASLVPTGERVATDNRKLVFVLHNGQHYLREVWNTNGRHVVTSQFNSPLADSDTQTEVRFLDQNRESQRAGRADHASQLCVAESHAGKSCQ
jgi:hypothetical protein